MYTIIGSDGKEYGPYTAEKIVGLIAEGRLGLDFLAKAGEGGEWRKLREFPELFNPAAQPVPVNRPDLSQKVESSLGRIGRLVGLIVITFVLSAILKAFVVPETTISVFGLFLILVATGVLVCLIVWPISRARRRRQKIIDENADWIRRAHDPALVEAIVSLRTELRGVRDLSKAIRWALVVFALWFIWVFRYQMLVALTH